jgi:hypothetical protein
VINPGNQLTTKSPRHEDTKHSWDQEAVRSEGDQDTGQQNPQADPQGRPHFRSKDFRLWIAQLLDLVPQTADLPEEQQPPADIGAQRGN